MSEEQATANEQANVNDGGDKENVSQSPEKQAEGPKLVNRTLKGLDEESLELFDWAQDKFPGNRTQAVVRAIAFAYTAMQDIEAGVYKTHGACGEQVSAGNPDIENLVEAVTGVKQAIELQTEMFRPLVAAMIKEYETGVVVAREHLAFIEQLCSEFKEYERHPKQEPIKAGKTKKGKKAKKKANKGSKKKVR